MDSKQIILAWELYEQNVLINDIAKHCNKHRSTISRWVCQIRKYGLSEYIAYYNQAKNVERPKRQINLYVKNLIHGFKDLDSKISGYQIQKILASKHHILISVSKVYALLKRGAENT